MGDYGIKVSKKGYDVDTANDQQLVITSKRNCLKVDEIATTTITTDGDGDGTRTIAHGLSFAPVVIALLSYNSGWYLMPALPTGTGVANYYVNTTNIVFRLSGFSAVTEYDIYYFLSETESAT